MAKAKNTINGKAFEYACLQALLSKIQQEGKSVSTLSNKPFLTAQEAFNTVSDKERTDLMCAAQTAVKLLVPLEPKLLGGEGMLQLEIAADASAIGSAGDVRDVLCVREEGSEPWTIGLSCKHNHEALRHPRITEKKDFGVDWLGISCDKSFIEAVTPVTDSLIFYGVNNTPWRLIESKQDNYYLPILKAYLDEIRRMCSVDPSIPERLLSYFFGANDFYKVIMKSSSRTTTIEGFNMHGTLNGSCGKVKALTKVPLIKMPTRLIDAAFKQNSKTTIILTFDGGWSISMRLHNKDEIARPTSLAWDVNLVGLPPTTYVNTHSWDE